MKERKTPTDFGEERVSKAVDCLVFEDQLDALVREKLPEEGLDQLRSHAAECPDCGMQLKVQEHLVGPSLEALEAEVPEEMVAAVWPGVREGIREKGAFTPAPEERIQPGPREFSFPRRPVSRWLVPTLAAASITLLFSSGILLRELNQVLDREAVLTQQVSEQQRWFAELQAGSRVDPVARTAALAGQDAWMRALSRQESISLQGLLTLLERMPGNRTVLSRAQLQSLFQSRAPARFRFLRNAVRSFEGSEGVSAEELLEALRTLDEDEDLTVPTAELVALLS